MIHAVIGKVTVEVPSEFTTIFNYTEQIELNGDRPTHYDIEGDEVHPTTILIMENTNQINYVLDIFVARSQPPVHYLIDMILISGVASLSTDVLNYIHVYTNGLVVNTYSWYRLNKLTDYELHRHFKCNWPVLPQHDPKWIARAVELGVPIGRLINLIGGEYPGAADDKKEERDAGHIATELQKQITKDAENRREMKYPPPDAERRERRNTWLMENTTFGHFEKISTLSETRIMTYEQAFNITQMYYNVGSHDYAMLTIWNLLVSTETAHLAIRNPPVMRVLSKLFDQYPKSRQPTALGALWYAFRTTYMEERMVGQKITNTSRAWWSEEQFMALPVFNYLPDRSPYCPIVCGDMSIYSQLPYYVVGNRRFTTREEYIERSNYVTRYCGPKKGISSVHSIIPHLGYSIPCEGGDQTIIYNSGGLHQSCMSVRPVEANFDNWNAYADMNYPDQHILARNEMDEFYTVANNRIAELDIIVDNVWDADTIIRAVRDRVESKEGEIHPHVKELVDLNDKMCSKIFTSSDVDISVHTKTHTKYVEVVHGVVDALRAAGYERIWIKEVPRKWKCKYSIMGPDLARPIDMYRVDISNIQLMRKFHFDCVRALWDGNKRWMLSSSIGSHLTGVNTTMIWLSNNKDPISLQCNYALRGFSKYTNTKMLSTFKKALENTAPFNKYPIVIGPVTPQHGIFVDKLLAIGKKIEVNNSKLEWPRRIGHVNYSNGKVCMPDTESFYGQITATMR